MTSSPLWSSFQATSATIWKQKLPCDPFDSDAAATLHGSFLVVLGNGAFRYLRFNRSRAPPWCAPLGEAEW